MIFSNHKKFVLHSTKIKSNKFFKNISICNISRIDNDCILVDTTFMLAKYAVQKNYKTKFKSLKNTYIKKNKFSPISNFAKDKYFSHSSSSSLTYELSEAIIFCTSIASLTSG